MIVIAIAFMPNFFIGRQTIMNSIIAQIPGIGLKTAKTYKALLPAGTSANIVSVRRAFCALSADDFDKLPIAAQIDLKYRPLHRIPRALIAVVDNEFSKHGKNNGRPRFDIAGSYRRGKLTSGDLDMVVSAGGFKNGTNAWKAFTKNVNTRSRKVRIHDPFSGHEDKITVLFEICLGKKSPLWDQLKEHLEPYHDIGSMKRRGSVYVKADVFLTDPKEYVFALLFATGSGTFNVRMRHLAKHRGYLLNQRGIYTRDGKRLDEIKTERDVFELLGMKYRTPKERVK